MRVPQPRGERGSLRWIQAAVNRHPDGLFHSLPDALKAKGEIQWLSPLEHDEFAEYRDADFLRRIQAAELADDLSKFWPARGPQWDALGRTLNGDILLVEAKAHIAEICGPPSKAASPDSLRQIDNALKETAEALDAIPLAPWRSAFYQYANRLAHLHFLRKHGKSAWMLFVYFVGDEGMKGPTSVEAWRAALSVMKHVMGLLKESPFVVEAFVEVSGLKSDTD